VLYQFGTGPIEGFAVALMIGVMSSVFTALILGRALFDFFADKGALGKLHMMSIVKPETKVPFMSVRRLMLAVSAVVIIIGIVGMGARSGSRNGMLGVDFTEGTNIVVNLHGAEPVEVGTVRSALIDQGFREPIVQEYEREDRESLNRFLIRISDIGTPEAVPGEEDSGAQFTVSERVAGAMEPLAQGVGPDGEAVDLERVETVGPAVGQQLRWNALEAIGYSLVFIIAYIWFRFEWRFSLGAVAALVHDVAITLGIFALTGKQITLPVVAAILTIIGYSLNDTIVVFDRIREDLRLYRGRGLSYPEIMNLSINQTLSRTLLTSGTTLIVVIVLFLFGGEVINDFAFALIVGVLVGTYSSVFVASPVVHYLQKWFGGGTQGDVDEKHPAQRRRRTKKSAKGTDEGEVTA
jgi:SecD/SecF fusion protein